MRKYIKKTNVLIVGAGLSGLHTACTLHKRGIEFQLVEARNRLGGRILSETPTALDNVKTKAAFDLGPSWFWPHQLRMQSLLKNLQLTQYVFEQTELGNGLYEDQNGNIHHGITEASMRGSYRIKGGIQKIITELTRQLPANTCRTQSTVKEISLQNKLLVTRIETSTESQEISSDFVVLALPPRLAVSSIKFNPDFSSSRAMQLNNIATWMAGHAKVALHYARPFWNQRGFSGDVISQRGPLQEIHDASSPQGSGYGLIGFFGLAAQARLEKQAELNTAVIAQLVRLFGEAAALPLNVYIKDWAFDQYTATIDDQQQLLFHPSSSLDIFVEPDWDNRLIWSGTETAVFGERNNGYLEGALEASERTIETLMSRLETGTS